MKLNLIVLFSLAVSSRETIFTSVKKVIDDILIPGKLKSAILNSFIPNAEIQRNLSKQSGLAGLLSQLNIISHIHRAAMPRHKSFDEMIEIYKNRRTVALNAGRKVVGNKDATLQIIPFDIKRYYVFTPLANEN